MLKSQVGALSKVPSIKKFEELKLQASEPQIQVENSLIEEIKDQLQDMESVPPVEFTLRGDDSMMTTSPIMLQKDQKMEEQEPGPKLPEFKINSVLKDFSANIKNYRKYTGKEKLPSKSI